MCGRLGVFFYCFCCDFFHWFRCLSFVNLCSFVFLSSFSNDLTPSVCILVHPGWLSSSFYHLYQG